MLHNTIIRTGGSLALDLDECVGGRNVLLLHQNLTAGRAVASIRQAVLGTARAVSCIGDNYMGSVHRAFRRDPGNGADEAVPDLLGPGAVVCRIVGRYGRGNKGIIAGILETMTLETNCSQLRGFVRESISKSLPADGGNIFRDSHGFQAQAGFKS